MGLRFRRSWSVIPGIRLNLGLRSGSVSFGTRGLHYTVGTSGSRITAGLPGTGLFWTQKINPRWGPSQAPRPNQPPGYLPPNPGVQTPHLHSPQIPSPPLWQTINPVQSATTQTPPPPQPGGGSHAPPTSYKHVLVPLWMFWSGLTVIVVGGLCLTAATIGKAIH
jgi:hypothetical protein